MHSGGVYCNVRTSLMPTLPIMRCVFRLETLVRASHQKPSTNNMKEVLLGMVIIILWANKILNFKKI